MSNKAIIDQVFDEHYSDLTEYVSKAIRVYNRNYDASVVVCECYLYLQTYDFGETADYKHVLGMAKHWCKQNIRWQNSPINLKCQGDRHGELIDNLTVGMSYTDPDRIDNVIDQFYAKLGAYEKGLFRMYYYQEVDNTTKIKNHLGVSKTSAYYTLLECRSLNDRFVAYVKRELT